MKKLYCLPALLIAVLLLSACSAKSESPASAPQAASGDANYFRADTTGESGKADYDYSGAKDDAGGALVSQDAAIRKIIYTANMSVTADDPSDALRQITDKALSLGGYVSASYTNNDDDGAIRCTATLKVPADQLDALVTAAQSVGTVNSYSLYSDDISMQYYDIRARLDNAKAEEKQLLSVLEQCDTVEDVLSVRQSLTQVRSDIESYQAQINLWDNLVDYATLELSIRRTQQAAVAGERKLMELWKASDVWAQMKHGFQNSLRFMANAFGAIGIFLAFALIPAAILFVLIGLPIILVRRNRRRKAAAAQGISVEQAAANEADASADRKAERKKRKAERKGRGLFGRRGNRKDE